MKSNATPIKSWLKIVKQIVSRQGVSQPLEPRWTPASDQWVQMDLGIGVVPDERYRRPRHSRRKVRNP